MTNTYSPAKNAHLMNKAVFIIAIAIQPQHISGKNHLPRFADGYEDNQLFIVSLSVIADM